MAPLTRRRHRALACGVAWVGWQVWHVNQDLSAAVADADQLQSAVAAGDDAATSESLGRPPGRQPGGCRPHRRTHLVGADQAAGRRGRRPWGAGGERRDRRPQPRRPAHAHHDRARPRRDRPEVGHDPAPEGQALQQPVATGAEAFGVADRRLTAEDPSQYVDRLAVKYRDLAHQVSAAADALRSADTAVRLLPAMLGADGPRNYLLVSAEQRRDPRDRRAPRRRVAGPHRATARSRWPGRSPRTPSARRPSRCCR